MQIQAQQCCFAKKSHNGADTKDDPENRVCIDVLMLMFRKRKRPSTRRWVFGLCGPRVANSTAIASCDLFVPQAHRGLASSFHRDGRPYRLKVVVAFSFRSGMVKTSFCFWHLLHEKVGIQKNNSSETRNAPIVFNSMPTPARGPS